MLPVATTDDIQNEIIEQMSAHADPLARYEYLIGQGRALLIPEADAIRVDHYAIPGCQFNVWIKAELKDSRLRLSADCDSLIYKGILALLLRVLDGRAPAEVREANLYFLERTGLLAQLSPSRANGLELLVKQIRGFARRYAE